MSLRICRGLKNEQILAELYMFGFWCYHRHRTYTYTFLRQATNENSESTPADMVTPGNLLWKRKAIVRTTSIIFIFLFCRQHYNKCIMLTLYYVPMMCVGVSLSYFCFSDFMLLSYCIIILYNIQSCRSASEDTFHMPILWGFSNTNTAY